jgi:hypothetical protein
MEVAHWQQRGSLVLQPLPAALMLTGRAVPVTAAVRPPMRALTLLAMPNGPAQLAGAALTQAAQYLEGVNRQSVTVKVIG